MTRLFEAKPFIVCEIGSNWQTLQHCLDSVSQAKLCGADAVKFQAFSTEELYGFRVPVRQGVTEAEPHRLPLDWLPALKAQADLVGIEFMCTAFSPELVAAVDPYVSVHKVASSDLCYPQLLEAVARCGKPVLLSTGAAGEQEIGKALEYVHPHTEVVLMYCVSAYPARSHDLRILDQLVKFRSSIGNRDESSNVGFSDHTTDILWAPVYAANWGAVAIEKHVTFFPDLDTPDRPHSLTGAEFKLMVDHIRGTREPVIGPTIEEKAMVLRHRRRLLATKDIAVGEVLTYGENYGAYRALEDDDHGLTPFLWNHEQWGPEGKPAVKAITKGKGVGPGDF